MREKLQKSVELAYWVGVAQTDGHFKKRRHEKRKRVSFLMRLHISPKSMPMLRKFKNISEKILGRNVKIYKIKDKNELDYTIGITQLLGVFQNLDINFSDPPTPPRWVKNQKFFGSYLAGVIDGDGDIRIKRPEYPQCVIRITVGKEPIELAKSIRRILNCSVLVTYRETDSVLDGRKIHGRCYTLEFCVSSKNFRFIEKHVLPHMTLTHKINKLNSFLNKQYP